MKKIFFLLLIINTFCSCNFTIPSKIKKNFTYCNEGRYTGLDTLINTHGIYYTSEIRSHGYNPVEIDTFYTTLMFWNDGTAKCNIWNPREIQPYFDKVLKRTEKGEKEYFYSGYWGNYRIVSDTIKIQCLWAADFYNLNDFWFGSESSYKIIDKNTLEYLPSLNRSLDPRIKYGKSLSESIKMKFLPVERVPSSNCWLKQKKWFWCNEEDWKSYKEKMKEKKKQ